MKLKKWITICSLCFLTTLKAEWLLIESIENVERIHNNVHTFWQENESLMISISKNEEISLLQKRSLLGSKDDLLFYFVKNPRKNQSDFKNSCQFILKNEENIIHTFGQSKFDCIINDFVCLKKLLKAMKNYI